MPLFIVLMIAQTSLLILIIFFIASYDEDAEVANKTLANFIFCMTIAESAIWIFSEIVGLIAITISLASALDAVVASLPINVIFILSMVLAFLANKQQTAESKAEHRSNT